MTGFTAVTDPAARWTRAMGLLAAARAARARMKTGPGTELAPNHASREYTTAVAALIHELAVLDETGVLAGVTDYVGVIHGREA